MVLATRLGQTFLAASGISLVIGCYHAAIAQDGIKALSVEAISTPARDQAPELHVTLNHNDHIYEIKEAFEVKLATRRDGFLYLLYVHSDDSVNVLFPNAFDTQNRISAGRTYVIPGAKFRIAASEPTGSGIFKAILVDQPIPMLSPERIPAGEAMLSLQLEQIQLLSKRLSKAAGVRFGESDTSDSANGRDTTQTEALRGPTILADHSVRITTRAKGSFGNGKRMLREKQRFVLAVGVGKQTAAGLSNFPACATEANEFSRLMREHYDAAEVIVLTNEEVTRTKVQHALKQFAIQSLPGDEFILFWSGHGGQVKDTVGDETDGIDEFLVLYDTDLSNEDRIRETSVTDDQLGRWIQEFAHCEVLVIFDTCFSGGQAANEKSLPNKRQMLGQQHAKRVPLRATITAKGEPDTWEGDFNAFSKDITPKQAMVISSSKAGQVSYVRETLDGSVMSFYLLEYLRTHRDQKFTPESLFHHVSKKAKSYVSNTWGLDQTPVIIGKSTSAIEF